MSSLTSSTVSSTSYTLRSHAVDADDGRSSISTETPGRVDKANVLHALQSSGESYDRARETLKHVSVDASGKVELEDWVEVRTARLRSPQHRGRSPPLVSS